jgi:carbamoyltransferase
LGVNVLGVYDGPFDASAAVVVDGRVRSAVQEERVVRRKHAGAFPRGAIRAALRTAGLSPGDVEHVAVSGVNYPIFAMRVHQDVLGRGVDLDPNASLASRLQMGLYERVHAFSTYHPLGSRLDHALSDRLLGRLLRSEGLSCPRTYVDHHSAHAHAAFLLSGLPRALVVTLDARGDGECATVGVGRGAEVERVASSDYWGSLGQVYGAVTEVLGFGFGLGEGKTMALAAFGGPSGAQATLDPIVRVEGLRLVPDRRRSPRLLSVLLARRVARFRREDVAYAVQRLLEGRALALVREGIARTGERDVACAGGVFYNVLLNKLIGELDGVRSVRPLPFSGDEGTAVGAALAVLAARGEARPSSLEHALLGPSYGEGEALSALREAGLEAERVEDAAGYVGEELLPRGRLVGWFEGGMEMGPRALGARSVLADPRDPSAPRRIRRTIKRRPAFQPFCPSMTEGGARRYLANPKGLDASFMISAFDATERAREELRAVVHVDGTMRPQVVSPRHQPAYHRVIEAFGRATGVPAVLNTSFNRSGEPIVMTPSDAVRSFLAGRLDCLVMGDLVVEGPRAG